MKYKLVEIVDAKELQILLDSFYEATGVATAILDIEGEILTATGWADICTKFHRVHPIACERCRESDIELASKLNKGEKYNIYRCKNGLIDIAVPIIIDGSHIGNLFTGQFLFEAPNVDFFKKQAEKFGFDEILYLEALKKVNIFSQDEIAKKMEFLTKLAEMIASLGLSRKHQLEINKQITELLESKEILHQEVVAEKEKLEILTCKLENSNKDLDDFAYIASHDLREPLRGINNYANFLIEDYLETFDEEGKDMLLSISRLAGRLDEFISALRFYSRIGRTKGVRENIPLEDIIKEVLESFEFTIKEHRTVISILENQPIIRCDRLNTMEIYKNLIGNALKYNDKSERYVEIGYLYKDNDPNKPILYVKDNGIGIDKKDYDKIFTIFKRLHPRGKFGDGTGAGLTIVKKCIDVQNGDIWVDSKMGEGTTFFFEIGKQKLTNSLGGK